MEPTAPPRTTLVRARTWPWLVAAAAVIALLFAEHTVRDAIPPTAAAIWLPENQA